MANRTKRRRRRPKRFPFGVALILLLVTLLAVTYAALTVDAQLSRISRENGGNSSLTQAEVEERDTFDADTITDELLEWGTAGVSTQVDGVCNILLMGRDTRDPDERGRSDSMILVSLNQNTNQITMVSLMRDLYVKVEGHGRTKLNHAYSYGGLELMDQTVEENFGISVDYNLSVNFEAFITVVDTIGGVTVDLYDEEVEYLNENYGWNLAVGENRLTGGQALAYSRIRYVGRDDFERTERQRTVLTSVFNEVKEEDLLTLLKLYESVVPYLATDMTNAQLLSLAATAYGMRDNGILSYRIPTDDLYRDETIRGMMVLVVTDWDALRAELWGYLYPETAGE